MDRYDLTHLTDNAVDLEWDRSVDNDRSSTADMLARLAEYDARQLYRRAGYPSMYAYCVSAKNFCENSARKRIHAARTARRFPALFVALAEGRLHLRAVVMLAPHLHSENFDELVRACSNRTAAQIEEILNGRFVRLETLKEGTRQESAGGVPNAEVENGTSGALGDLPLIDPSRALGRVEEGAGISLQASPQPASPPRASSQAQRPEPSFSVVLEKSAQELLEYARALMSHRMPLASASQVIEHALKDLIAREEKRKFAATDRPKAPRASRSARHIPAYVKRAVWKRDGGRCTAVGSDGHPCNSREFLEYDHVQPVARGGRATVATVQLRCRAHNQYEAEQAFGADFMKRKREQRQSRGDNRRTFPASPAPERKRAPG